MFLGCSSLESFQKFPAWKWYVPDSSSLEAGFPAWKTKEYHSSMELGLFTVCKMFPSSMESTCWNMKSTCQDSKLFNSKIFKVYMIFCYSHHSLPHIIYYANNYRNDRSSFTLPKVVTFSTRNVNTLGLAHLHCHSNGQRYPTSLLTPPTLTKDPLRPQETLQPRTHHFTISPFLYLYPLRWHDRAAVDI